MNTTSMYALMDLFVLGAALYILYHWYMLMFKGDLRQGVIISKNTNPDKCKDLEGLKAFMGTKTLILGILGVISGCIGLYQDYVAPLPQVVYWVSFFLFLGWLVVYATFTRKAEKKFF